jgi:hypothetical protein
MDKTIHKCVDLGDDNTKGVKHDGTMVIHGHKDTLMEENIPPSDTLEYLVKVYDKKRMKTRG